MNKEKEPYLTCHLKDLANKHGYNASTLANATGERRTTLGQLMNDQGNMHKRRIPANLIANLCHFFNVTPNDLFEVHYKEKNNE